MPERYPPDDPREWINRAYSDLAIAKAVIDKAYIEDLCYHTQQAVEKAVKALLLKYDVEFPYVHNIAQLLTLLEEVGQEIPEFIRESEKLTRFAVFVRYPGITPIKRLEYEQAIVIAENVVQWAENIVNH
ncbi:MAG: HEPN domain-containing protein [Candidatus Poribacteria bacterium]